MADLEITDASAGADAGPSTPPTSKPHIDDHKPNPKVAVAVAGAALALTTGLTLLVLPYVRQAAKLSAPPQFLSHAHRSRPLRALDAKPVPAAAPIQAQRVDTAPAPFQAQRADTALAPSQPIPPEGERCYAPQPTPDAEPSTIQPPAEPLSALEAARAFNNREEDALYGPASEEGETLHPVSPWLGFQALGIATAIVGASTALGVWGAAKWLGVGSMEEFAAKMRGSLEDQLPELITNVRRDDGRAIETGPNVLGGDGDVDDGKLTQWIRWIEGDKDKRDTGKGE